jgi:hypothetical protein
LQERWKKTLKLYEQGRADEQGEAEDRWIKLPTYKKAFWRIAADTREEDTPEFHLAHQALTRLTDPTAQVICLYGTAESPYLDREKTQPIDLNSCPSLTETKDLLLHSVAVASKHAAIKLLETDVPKGWRQAALLRNHRVLTLNDAGETEIGGYLFQLNPELGLKVTNARKEIK